MHFQRTCGILMPISSLPGGYGIGSLGRPAHRFVDFLASAGQSIWQILPVGPTGYADSPYQSCSAFAGNPYLIDLDLLRRDGLLKREQYAGLDWGRDPLRVDYGALYERRFTVLRCAYRTFMARRPLPGCDTPYPDDWYRFTLRSTTWLPDYSLYMAIKQAYGMVDWQRWPEPLRLRDPAALEAFAAEHAEDIGFWTFVQYLFDQQWRELKTYANRKGVRIMGDIPIYVAADSADVWAGRDLFEMDAAGHPKRVAGCPPDYFAKDGQLWGNPLYDWAAQKQTGYAWWIRRIRHALSIYDILRIDHFRGFDTYWAIPADAPTARTGRWEQGPGLDLFDAVHAALGDVPIVAEDLGEIFPSVRKLLADAGLPGMRVLQFGFGGEDSLYLPHNYPQHCVAYPGTHDNNTLAAWFAEELSPAGRRQAIAYLALTREEGWQTGLLRGVLASAADVAIIPLADWLCLGSEARMNTPGKAQGNWCWRAGPDVLDTALARHIRTMCARYFRTSTRHAARSTAPAPAEPAAEPTPASPAAEPAAETSSPAPGTAP